MLVSELAERADVPLATVKYYLRAGLLPPGRVTGPRRAEYDEAHLRRLRILRLLREVGGAPVSALQAIVDAADDDALSMHEVLCRISDALSPPLALALPGPAASQMVDVAIAEVGWSGVRRDAADRLRLAELIQLVSDQKLLTITPEIVAYYVRVVDGLCRTEVELIETGKDRAGMLGDMIAGEAAFGEMLALLRRMGHEHYHAVGQRVAPQERAVNANARSDEDRSQQPSPG